MHAARASKAQAQAHVDERWERRRRQGATRPQQHDNRGGHAFARRRAMPSGAFCSYVASLRGRRDAGTSRDDHTAVDPCEGWSAASGIYWALNILEQLNHPDAQRLRAKLASPGDA